MLNTYRQLRIVSKDCVEDVSPEDMALKYQEEQVPELLADVFCKFFGFTNNISKNYFYLSGSDKASFALEELHRSMLDYAPNCGAKLMTLYGTYYRNRLRSEIWVQGHQKRKANYGADSYEEIATNGLNKCATVFRLNEGEQCATFEEIELLETIRSLDLTESEFKYCQIIIEDKKVNNSDIAEKLGVSNAMVTYIKNKLQEKLSFLLL